MHLVQWALILLLILELGFDLLFLIGHFIELLFKCLIFVLQIEYLVVKIVDLCIFLILAIHLWPHVILLKLVQLISQVSD